MRVSKLPQDIKELLWKYGLAGRRIYVPRLPSPNLVTDHLPLVLMQVEEVYHNDGITFYLEKSARDRFSGNFGKNKIASRFKLKLRTAASVSSAAWKAWREWFGHKERPHLERLRALADEAGCEYTPFYFSYLTIRGQIRSGQEVDMEYYAGYHSVSREIVHQVVDLSRASVESCPWRLSPNDG